MDRLRLLLGRALGVPTKGVPTVAALAAFAILILPVVLACPAGLTGRGPSHTLMSRRGSRCDACPIGPAGDRHALQGVAA
jgi:hypothetical protein